MENASNLIGFTLTALAIVGVCMLVSCRSFPEPVPEDPVAPDASIGIGEQIAKNDATEFRVIFVHGIGIHESDYADDWVTQHLAPSLALRPLVDGTTTVPIRVPGQSRQPEPPPLLKIYEYKRLETNSSPELGFRFNAITWSPLTKGFKDRLADQEDGVTRAPLNKALKYLLMDRTLADAVLYIGQYRKVLKSAVSEGLCRALSGQPADAGGCDWAKVDTSRMRLVFVTHSLGSRMLFDVLIDLLEDEQVRTRLLPALNREPSFFMFANQLSLLALGDQDAPPVTPAAATFPLHKSGLRGFAEALHRARKAAGTDEAPVAVNAVAFTDPNDVLSYKVPAGIEYNREGLVRFVNVRISNAATILWTFESPIAAHTGYMKNPRVWDVVVNGVPGRRGSRARGQDGLNRLEDRAAFD